ncbi:MAG: nucleotidyltransferase domain-containing protein [Elusimicrobiota bacterium]
MAKRTNLGKDIFDFISEIKKNIKVKSIYFFGSYVKGKSHRYSDIDLAIVSDDFTGFKFEDRKKINPLILKTNINIEVHPFTAKEFKEKNPFVKEIIETGKRLF